jgi:hypothetical protein
VSTLPSECATMLIPPCNSQHGTLIHISSAMLFDDRATSLQQAWLRRLGHIWTSSASGQQGKGKLAMHYAES